MKSTYVVTGLVATIAGCGTSPTAPKIEYSRNGLPCAVIQSSDRWITTADNPRWGDAVMASMLGQKDAAARMVTGGLLKQVYVYDWNGNPYAQTVNENGEIVKVIDLASGCPVGQKIFAERKLFFKSRDEAPGWRYKVQTELQ